MIPVIAIVGRPNVGKSTLFNRLTRSRDALVIDQPGVTRDRQYGQGKLDDRDFIVIDTGGIGADEHAIDAQVFKQTQLAIDEADVLLLMVDGRSGITAADEILTAELRRINKPIYLVVNKTDALDPQVAMADFYQLGLGKHEPIPISASLGRGIQSLLQTILPAPADEENLSDDEIIQAREEAGIKVAIIGRPNVGKSTLVNRMLGEERVIVFDEAGTTRDSIAIPFERFGKHYTLIDTAGVRRRTKITETVEKFSVIKTMQAINTANVVILMIDAREGIKEQDLRLLGLVLEAGRALIISVNKWDGLSESDKDAVRKELDRRLTFVDFAKWHFISALHGSGVGDLYESVEIAYNAATQTHTTSQLTKLLEQIVESHPPPLVRGRRIKLRYAHAGGRNPPIIVIHGNQVSALPLSYQRYLMNRFRELLKLQGTPLKIELRAGKNPYVDQKTTSRKARGG